MPVARDGCASPVHAVITFSISDIAPAEHRLRPSHRACASVDPRDHRRHHASPSHLVQELGGVSAEQHQLRRSETPERNASIECRKREWVVGVAQGLLELHWALENVNRVHAPFVF